MLEISGNSEVPDVQPTEWASNIRHSLERVTVCAVKRQCLPSGCKSRPANSVAPAGSYRSGGGGNEAVGAFETHVPPGGAASPQAVTRVNAEQASKDLTWEPTRQ